MTMPEKELAAQTANVIAASGFALTLAHIDTMISIAVGCVGLVAAFYSIVWHKVRIAKERQKNDESNG